MDLKDAKGKIEAQSASDSLYDLLRMDDVKTVTKRNVADPVTVLQTNYTTLDGNSDQKITLEELRAAQDALKMQNKPLATKVVGALMENFETISSADGDANSISGMDLAKLRYQKNEHRQENALLDKLTGKPIERLFKQANDGVASAGLSYQEIDHALKNDKLNTAEREMLGYLLLNYDDIKGASQTDPDGDNISIADLNAFQSKRRSEIPDTKELDGAATTIVRRRIRVPRQSSGERPMSPQDGVAPESPRWQAPESPRSP